MQEVLCKVRTTNYLAVQLYYRGDKYYITTTFSYNISRPLDYPVGPKLLFITKERKTQGSSRGRRYCPLTPT